MVAWSLKCSATIPFAPGKSQDLTSSSASQGRRPRLQLRGLSGFLFSAFFQRSLARKFYPTFVVNADALDPNDVANFRNVFSAFHAKIRELGDVHEPIPTLKHFDKRAEFLRRDYASLIGLADLDFTRHATDNFLRACHALAAGGVNVHGTIVFNINFSAGFRDNALDGLATGPDECPDLFGVNLNRLDPRRVLRQLCPRFIQRAAHDAENFRARFFSALDRFGHDFVANTWQFQIQLKTGNAFVGSAELEIHIAKMIFRADDVGQQFVAF